MIKIILSLVCSSVFSLSAENQPLPVKTPESASFETSKWDQCSQFLESITKNDPMAMENYRNFAASLKLAQEDGSISEEGIEKIIKAIEFSAEKHQFQKRKAPPFYCYISHPIAVSHQILQIGKVTDVDVLIAALLHDTVEDTQTSFEEIRNLFGETVEGYVREVTDDKSIPKAERKQAQIDHAPDKSPAAACIKLSDKLHNLNDMVRECPLDQDGVRWPEERLEQYFKWAKQVTDALPKVNAPLTAELENTYANFWHSRG